MKCFHNLHHSWLWYANGFGWLTYKQAKCLILIIMKKENVPLNWWCSNMVNQYPYRVSGWDCKVSSTSKSCHGLVSYISLIKPIFKNLKWLFTHTTGFKTTGKWIAVLHNDFLQMQSGCYLNKDKWVFMFLWMNHLDRYAVQLLTDITFTQQLFMSLKYCFI